LCRPAAAAGRGAMHVQIVQSVFRHRRVACRAGGDSRYVTIERGLDRLFSGPTREVIQTR